MSAEITVKVRPEMSMPLETGGYVEGGKSATITRDYWEQVKQFVEYVPELEDPPKEEPATPAKK